MLFRPRESMPATLVMSPIRLPRAHSGGLAMNASSPGRTTGVAAVADGVDVVADREAHPSIARIAIARYTASRMGRTAK
jgi:hypothetical protein